MREDGSRHGLSSAIITDTGQNKSSPEQQIPENFSTVFTNEKAGMQHVDKEKVKRVVYDMSKDSVHHENELRKQVKVKERISNMKAIQSGLSASTLQRREQEMQPLLAQLEAQRDLSQVWLHVDMDAFYAACEERDNPELKEIPIAIGGMSMISTANYEARKYGVRAAMPGFIAIKLCPSLKFIKSNFKKYEAAAAKAREVFSRFDPTYTARGLDEACLCITKHCAETGKSPMQVAEELRTQVYRQTCLTCSCGTAPNTMLAKICSDIKKPNGQFHIDSSRNAVMSFIEDLSIRKVPGIGRVSEQLLNEFGVYVVPDLYRNRGLLSHLFSSISMNFFMHVALGLGSTQHHDMHENAAEGRKSVSHERTFAALECREDLQRKIAELAVKISQDLQSLGMCGKCITLKLKQTDFRVRQRSTTLPTFIDSYEAILAAANKLLSCELPIKVRLMGVKVSSLQDARSTTRLERFLRQADRHVNGCLPAKVPDFTYEVGGEQMQPGCRLQNTENDDSKKQVEPCTATAADYNSLHQETACLDREKEKTTSVLCKECGASVLRSDLQEHEDMHIAMALSRKVNGPSYVASETMGSGSTGQVPASTKRRACSPVRGNRTTSQKRKSNTPRDSILGGMDLFLTRRIGKG